MKNLGVYHWTKSEYETALDYLHQSLGDKKGMAASYNNIGAIYYNQSDYPQALDYYFKALKIDEELGNKQGMATTYNNIGIIFWNQSSYSQAFGYYFKSLKIDEELLERSGNPDEVGRFKQGMARSYNNIGNIYYDQFDYPNALDYYFKSLKIKEELDNKQGMALSYTNIGSLYSSLFERGDNLEKVDGWAVENPTKLLDTAMYYQQKALNLQTELSAEYDITFSLSGIASILMQKGEYSHALEYCHQSALLADSIGALQRESEAHSELAECYEKLGNNKLALDHYKQYSTLKDTIFNEEKSKDIGKLEAKHEFEMAEMERKKQEEEQARIEKEATERSNLLQYSAVLLFIVALFITLLFSGKLHIPEQWAKGGVFFTFLLLFEFLLLIIDPFAEQLTGGEPAYKLMINAALAGLFLPLHNFADSKLRQRLFKTKKILVTKALPTVSGQARHKETRR